jgi:sugar lactone lactonase YvrE
MLNTIRVGLFALIALPAAAAMSAPIGYSVNSDQPDPLPPAEPVGDRLFAVNLETGDEQAIGFVTNTLGMDRTDVEGLAFDPAGTLWGVDDESGRLFPISTASGLVQSNEEVPLNGFEAIKGNDFGLTFTCSGDLYMTSVKTRSLYRLELDGTAELVGSAGALGANISAIAAIGSPARLYGLSNGLLSEGGAADTRSLYEISTTTGVAELIGTLGDQASDYFQAGLSFDADGNLWAITDRRTSVQALGSEVLRVDTETGAATLIHTTDASGFESLAIAPLAGCETPPVQEPPAVEPPAAEAYPNIPTLDRFGLVLTSLVLLLTGLLTLRRVNP